MSRKYEMKRRAERQEETRQRIVEATVQLHQERGMARTSISDIAQRAGVERATVYRHFPKESELFSACTSRYFEDHPLPDPGPWQEIPDPLERLRAGLGEIYAFHSATEAMMERTLREVFELTSTKEVAEQTLAYWHGVIEVLASGWNADGSQQHLVAALIGHAVDFWTWKSLVRTHGLSREQAVDVMTRLVWCNTQDQPGSGNVARVDFGPPVEATAT